jgi:hypothetical protein
VDAKGVRRAATLGTQDVRVCGAKVTCRPNASTSVGAQRLIERYRRTPNGPKMPMITTTQMSVIRAGFSAGKPVPTYGFGLPHRSRRAAVSVLVGFHSAIGVWTSGMVAGGTNTF